MTTDTRQGQGTSTALTEAAVIASTQTNAHQPAAYELALVQGDLSKLTTNERLAYYRATCKSLGLNELTRPFDYLTLNGKLTLYAKRDAADQLRRLNRVSVTITSRETAGGVYVVTARATTPDGRSDESIGAIAIDGLRGEALANAYMKAETKSKRRVTLSICGLGWLDETEVETIPDARPVTADAPRARAMEPEDAELRGIPEVRPVLPATEPQIKAVYAIGKGARGWSDDEIDEACRDKHGVKPSELNRRQASDFIEYLKGAQ
jgi:hypothetical protein